MSKPLQMIFVMFAGWVNEHQQVVIAYLQEENRVLREVQGKKRLRFNDDQRRRLAAKGRALGRRSLRDIGFVVTPDTILRWHRELVHGSRLEDRSPVPQAGLTPLGNCLASQGASWR